jgi:hypothetical protein
MRAQKCVGREAWGGAREASPRAPRPTPYGARLFPILLWTTFVGAAPPPGATGGDDWKFDVIRLKNGKSFQGLLVEDGPAEIRFRCVRRSPGSPTVVIFTTFTRQEVASIDRLEARDRETLEGRLKALDPTGKGEAERMENLELESVPWIKPGDGDAFRYRSVHFVLISNAREDIVRRAAVRLEQIYSAYSRFLPPRHQTRKPTAIYLVRSLAEYQALLRDQHRNILNPAFYDGARNQILCASDLQRLGDDLEKVRKIHQQILDDLKDEERNLGNRYKGKIPPALKSRLDSKRQEVNKANADNDRLFKEATRHLFQTLYHEAFHAYLANFVYPKEEGEVPRWLNEGLAQIFETALVEAGELRVGHADADRLARIKTKVRKAEVVPLTELIRAGPKKFLVNLPSDQLVSDRYYLNAWALSFYLTFDRRLLGTPALDQYIQSLKRGTDPLEAFRQLAGMPLTQFENEYHQYLLRLRPDGTVARAPMGK